MELSMMGLGILDIILIALLCPAFLLFIFAIREMLHNMAKEASFYWTLWVRPHFDDEAFYEQFYANSGIPKDIPCRLRKFYCREMGGGMEAIIPEDSLGEIFDELDFGEFILEAAEEFNVKMPIEVAQRLGTFDSIVRCLAHHRQTNEWPACGLDENQ